MFGSKLKVKTVALLCTFVFLIFPVTLASAGSTKDKSEYKNYINIASIVAQECKNYVHVPPEIILAIIKKESNFHASSRHTTKSGTEFLGAMQINKQTARNLWKHFFPNEKFNVTKYLTPEINIKLGIWHFNNTLAKYRNNVEMALTAYNMGEGGFKNHMVNRGTYVSEYSRTVMILSRKYKVN